MVKVTCYKCHWTWTLNQEATQAAYESLGPDDKYYAAHCPQCGRLNKVAVDQLKRWLPSTPSTEDSSE
jgi:ssDNA-binding Zn-finger/Zn-ribbon topoisomerase 1